MKHSLILATALCLLLGCSTYDEAFKKGKEQQRLDHELVYACFAGDFKKMQALIDQGADPNGRSCKITVECKEGYYTDKGMCPHKAVVISPYIEDEDAAVEFLNKNGLRLADSEWAAEELNRSIYYGAMKKDSEWRTKAFDLIKKGVDVNYREPGCFFMAGAKG